MTGDLDEVRRLLDPAVVLVGDGGRRAMPPAGRCSGPSAWPAS
ncbi:MAG: hypothetical protein R2713_10385 [Ilumatobacteraceae bacterium]